MADNALTTSVTITFATQVAEGDGVLKVEVDSEDNGGKSQFSYGDKAVFRVYCYPANMKLNFIVSDGVIMDAGYGADVKEDLLQFTGWDPKSADANTAGLSYPPSSGITSIKWLGNSLGSISVQSGDTAVAARRGVGVAKITYPVSFLKKGLILQNKSEPEYPVVVFVVGTIT